MCPIHLATQVIVVALQFYVLVHGRMHPRCVDAGMHANAHKGVDMSGLGGRQVVARIVLDVFIISYPSIMLIVALYYDAT